MSILYADCRLGITERTLFAGLMDLGLSSQGIDSLPQIPDQPVDGLLLAIHENRVGSYLSQEDGSKAPTIPLKRALAWLDEVTLPADLREETRQILSCAAGYPTFSLDNARVSVEGVFLLLAILDGLQKLQVDTLYSSPLPVSLSAAGSELLQILRDGSIPLTAPVASSRVTLLGAALLAKKASFIQPDMRITNISQVSSRIDGEERISMRLMLGEPIRPAHGHIMSLIQTNLDDITPHQLSYVVEKLITLGALETYQIPIGMKKNRLGTQLNAVVRAKDETRMVETILRETPTLGVRIFHIDDHAMTSYEIQPVATEYGEIPVKIKLLGGKAVGLQPEVDVCARKAVEYDLPLGQIFAAAQTAAQERYQERLK